MTNNVELTTKLNDKKINVITEGSAQDAIEQVTELSEDMVMVSPGSMLQEARKDLSLSQEYIASKLNFKVGIVQGIEINSFDPSIPVTFIRGYLTNYAKLVGVDVQDVLSSYDALDAATIQRSEMLSFSKETSKQAEHSRVMWLSYLIVGVLVGLTILWWLQESRQQGQDSLNISPSTTPIIEEVKTNKDENSVDSIPIINHNLQKSGITEGKTEAVLSVKADAEQSSSHTTNLTTIDVSPNIIESEVVQSILPETQPVIPELSTAVFTFKEDCWVNIFDATGERIAWGVKKSGYVMTIQGKAPLRITVGKPELTSIVFNDQSVDMSTFNVGNIAKFNLPIVE